MFTEGRNELLMRSYEQEISSKLCILSLLFRIRQTLRINCSLAPVLLLILVWLSAFAEWFTFVKIPFKLCLSALNFRFRFASSLRSRWMKLCLFWLEILNLSALSCQFEVLLSSGINRTFRPAFFSNSNLQIMLTVQKKNKKFEIQ